MFWTFWDGALFLDVVSEYSRATALATEAALRRDVIDFAVNAVEVRLS